MCNQYLWSRKRRSFCAILARLANQWSHREWLKNTALIIKISAAYFDKVSRDYLTRNIRIGLGLKRRRTSTRFDYRTLHPTFFYSLFRLFSLPNSLFVRHVSASIYITLCHLHLLCWHISDELMRRNTHFCNLEIIHPSMSSERH